jgi:hypothetical protein
MGFTMPAAKGKRPEAVGFSDQYPEHIGDRLAWFARELGIGEGRLLSLLGLIPSAAPSLPSGGVDWEAVVRKHEDQAWWAEGILYDTLALFDYDARALCQFLSGSAARDGSISGPGGVPIALSELSPAERDRLLLTLVAVGGPVGRQALLAYLAQPDHPLPTVPWQPAPCTSPT